MCENNSQPALNSPKEPTQSESIAKLAGALAKAQGEIHGAKKDADNPFISKQRPGAGQYATLHSVWEACRESLSNNGLAVIQTTGNSLNGIMVITTLVHSSGEWIRGSLDLPLVKKDPQTVGSVITYGRRYTLAAITGVAPGDDDDAEKAMAGHRNGTDQKQPSKKPDDVAVPQIENISDRIKKCKATKELENVWKKHVNPVTWQQDEYVMLKNLAASRKAEIIAGLKEEKGSKKATQKEETALEKVKKYATKIKSLNKAYGDVWFLQQCGNLGFSNSEEMDEKNLQQLLAKLVDKGLELKASLEEKEHGKLAA